MKVRPLGASASTQPCQLQVCTTPSSSECCLRTYEEYDYEQPGLTHPSTVPGQPLRQIPATNSEGEHYVPSYSAPNIDVRSTSHSYRSLLWQQVNVGKRCGGIGLVGPAVGYVQNDVLSITSSCTVVVVLANT